MSNSPLLEDSNDAAKYSLWFGPNITTDGVKEADLLVYFVPGNPCLISYYDEFLSKLSKLLNVGNSQDGGVRVGGYTLPGFQTSNPTIIQGTLPAGLRDQILNVEELVCDALEDQCQDYSDHHGGRRVKVIFMAHSVGAYMMLEVLRRRAEHLNRLEAVDIIGAVLSFPTVTEIAQSQHGTMLSVCLWLKKIYNIR